jgi:hypothetical protein
VVVGLRVASSLRLVPRCPAALIRGLLARKGAKISFFVRPARDCRSENQQSSVEVYLDDLKRIRIEICKV